MNIKSNESATSLADRAAEDFTPAPLPPLDADGGVVLTPARTLPVVDRPSICTVGPCSRYHRMVTSFDAATALDGSSNGNARQTVHFCYPSPGVHVELDLGDVAVYECNRWSPIPHAELEKDESQRWMYGIKETP